MKKTKAVLPSSELSELIERFSQQNIVAEMEKRYQSAPARLVPTDLIDDNRFIEEVVLPTKTIQDFSTRIKEKGFYNPLVVRQKENERYEIILGRKRYVGAKEAGLVSLPCVIAEAKDEEVLLMLLADTRDQREANVVEMALVCKKLQDDFGYTQQMLADLSYQSRPQITNILRILRLPSSTRKDLCLGKLSYGHAKVIVSLPQEEIVPMVRRIQKEKLSVRKTEEIVTSFLKGNEENESTLVVAGGSMRKTKRSITFTFETEEALAAFLSTLKKKD